MASIVLRNVSFEHNAPFYLERNMSVFKTPLGATGRIIGRIVHFFLKTEGLEEVNSGSVGNCSPVAGVLRTMCSLRRQKPNSMENALDSDGWRGRLGAFTEVILRAPHARHHLSCLWWWWNTSFCWRSSKVWQGRGRNLYSANKFTIAWGRRWPLEAKQQSRKVAFTFEPKQKLPNLK